MSKHVMKNMKKTEATGQSSNGLTTQRKETKTSKVQTSRCNLDDTANLECKP